MTPAAAFPHSLPRVLDLLGPVATPAGRAHWSRQFPMAGETLEFVASLGRQGDVLTAQVDQIDGGAPRRVFEATWHALAGSWMFQAAELDGACLPEGRAVATFGDYVQALGVDPVVDSAAPERPRRRGVAGSRP